MKKQRCK